mgnify:CR=1 FL=1
MDLWRSEETMTPEATIGDAEVVTSVATAHVLLIEDDLVIAEDVAGFLETRGMAVTHLSTGAAALSRAVTGEWDAIVLDRMLPEVDGLDLLRRHILAHEDDMLVESHGLAFPVSRDLSAPSPSSH